MFSGFGFPGKGSSSGPAKDGDVPSQNLNHFQGEKSISVLSSLLSLANSAVCSDVLFQSWKAIREAKDGFNSELSGDINVQFTEKVLAKYNIIVFVSSPITKSCLLEKTELISSSTVSGLSSAISGFGFLRSSRRNSSFSINKAALSLFHSREGDLYALVDEIANEAECKDSKPYIITGDGIGGSVASLFALLLLFKINAQKAKTPLCVTFGSPLLGDSGLQKAISEHQTWNSNFLHVVSLDDCFPSLYVQSSHRADGQMMDRMNNYHPFGRFMFCSNSSGACFQHPESALDLLRKMSTKSGGNEESFNYDPIIANLRKDLIYRGKTNLNAHGTGSSMGKTSVAAQYLASLLQLQDVARNSQSEGFLENEMSVLDQKRHALEKTAKDLNEAKLNMAYIEWYKKRSEQKDTPYYDSHKNLLDIAAFRVATYIGRLQNYWGPLVKDAAEKPQKAGAALRDRWLLGGTTYRKLVEPLAIADYYRREDARNYIAEGRAHEKLKHYQLLGQWFKAHQAKENTEERNAQNADPPSLTEDSCFWAFVEEAIISCRKVIMGESTSSELEKLKEFEKYFSEQIGRKQVSSDIFLGNSSFMKWWEDYKRILDQELMGASYTSPLTEIMHERE